MECSLSFLREMNSFPQSLQVCFGMLSSCSERCSLYMSYVKNTLLHFEQGYSPFPVCRFRICLTRSALWLKVSSHDLHLFTWLSFGFLEWKTCLFIVFNLNQRDPISYPIFTMSLSQFFCIGGWYFRPLCSLILWTVLCCVVINVALHSSHWMSAATECFLDGI